MLKADTQANTAKAEKLTKEIAEQDEDTAISNTHHSSKQPNKTMVVKVIPGIKIHPAVESCT